MPNLDETLNIVSAKVDKLVADLVTRWEIESELQSAPPTGVKDLKEKRDQIEAEYNNLYAEIQTVLISNGFPKGDKLEEIMKKIAGVIYTTASAKFSGS